MNDTITVTTTKIASGVGTPMCGHTFDAIAGRLAVPATSGAGVRDRRGVVALGHAEKSFPWTTAWRPPIS